MSRQRLVEIEEDVQGLWADTREHPFDCDCEDCGQLSALVDEWLSLENLDDSILEDEDAIPSLQGQR